MAARRTLSLILGALIVLAAVLVGAPPASAATDCTTTITDQTIEGNVNVPTGGVCVLKGSTVTGGITVQPGGALFVLLQSWVAGNITAEQALVQVNNHSTVQGNIISNRPLHIPGFTNSAFVLCESTVRGSVIVRNGVGTNGILIGSPKCQETGSGSTVGGSVIVTNNQAGVIEITDNVIKNTLYCVGNAPPPTGGSNTAASKIGQCAGL